MLVSVYCTDAAGSVGPREDKLTAHLQHVKKILAKLKVGGPILSPDGGALVGSLLVLEVASVAEAETIMRSDPYYQAGVWQELKIQEYRGVAGSWVGGKSW